ncbi:MAG TPA: ABC transporter ATP-binding protein [Thermoanaerobaculia bacterium]|nr:MAG: Daunorubicin/doxorubicin resistance ATP-binding protein DrrA [Acidobacteria bacterium ADurb.Bin051]HPA95847.1 ABC transporter ATP-binding protein [Thermoanaerobaculia bacterium]HQN38666.1 ABC transporter ATP-binding protein [Thermoanaerobaculia bacterium]HRR13744.1 ABC transporter ATP-binding protein [Thermoanaerobaculia bacterium]HRS35497.1 ABC transporter ATP-binding protein [Thermoanaerobaculia bacterium]
MPAVEIRSLARSFGALRALDGIDLDLHAGEVLGLLGPNGAGKSTLVRTLTGRVRPDAGTIRLLGEDADAPGARRALGYVPQEIALYPLLTARENLALFGRFQGLEGAALREAVARGIAFSSLTDRANEPIEPFSGGMKRRLNLAAGILHRPRIVLLDEPTVGVDPQSRERIYAMIGELAAGGAAVLYTTHYMEEAERLCDRVAVIDHGRVIAVGSRDELVRATIGSDQELVVDVAAPFPSALETALTALGARLAGQRLQLATAEPAAATARVLDLCARHGASVTNLRLESPTLQRVFLHLTGRELRE